MPSPPSRLRVVLSLAMAVCGVLAACSDTGAARGKGDTVVVDVEASTGEQLPQTGTATPDSSYGMYIDANALPSACTTCTCDTTTTFCFGGSAEAGTFSGTCNVSGGGIAIGCNALPSACANEPSCPCILAALQGQLPCTYAKCSDTNFSVTCE